MSEFERQAPSYRLAEVHAGDDLQSVAAREMGDANRWVELVWLNRLAPPYITHDPGLASPSVLLVGAQIKVPAPAAWGTGADDGDVFARDCLMSGRQLHVDDGGDLAVVSGVDNLRQQLQHALDTPRGQARRNPEYGCMTHRLIGAVSGPTAGALAAQYNKATLQSDYRVSRVVTSVARVSGDAIIATAKVVAIDGSSINLASEA